jgi:hypothetical protein
VPPLLLAGRACVWAHLCWAGRSPAPLLGRPEGLSPLWAGRMLPHWTSGTDLLCATVSAGRRLEVAPSGARRAGWVSLRVEIWRWVPAVQARSTRSSVVAGWPGLAGLAEQLPAPSRGPTLQAFESLRPLGGPGCHAGFPDDYRADLLPRTDRTTRRAVPSPVLHAGSVTEPTPLLRNRFQSLVRFPSRHAAVRSADEPVSPSFDPSCED